MSRHQSIWAATAPLPRYRPLDHDLHANVAIVGGGISGLTTAYRLAQAGRSVVVLDDGPLGGGMTLSTTAQLMSMMDDRYFEVERLHGEHGARLAAQSHSAAIDAVQSIVLEEHIACDFTRLSGYLFLAREQPPEVLDKELVAAHRAGLAGVERLECAPGLPFNTGPCLHFPRQGQFHPLKYVAGLASAILRRGGFIFTDTHADSVEGGDPAIVAVGEYIVRADAVVVATNVPINDRLAIHTKQAPYMTYVVGMRVPKGTVPELLLWDTGDPYLYVRRQALADHDVLMVGGEDHKSGQAHDAAERYARLEAWARQHFPSVEATEFQWSGQVMETIDYLAFIGRNPLDKDNVYIVTGDSGMGMTHGTIAGSVIADLIMGRANPWAALYDPSRKTLAAVRDYASENLNVARQYADWMTRGDVESAEEIAPGTGALVRSGLSMLAVYRDLQGELHSLSAACPHLGCIVQWNADEKTWDCPCHGSRFDAFGGVINGPANVALKRVDEPIGARA